MSSLPNPAVPTPPPCHDVRLVTCTKCGAVKPATEFNFRDKARVKLRSGCKACQSEENRAYAVMHSERRIAYMKKRREDDPEKAAEIEKRYRETHPDRVVASKARYRSSEAGIARQAAYAASRRGIATEQDRQRRLANPEKYEAYQAAYREMNRDAIRIRRQEWVEQNPGSIANIRARYRHRRRAMEANAPCTLTTNDWAEILRIQGGKCARCKRKFSSSLRPNRDHIVPLSKGGALTLQNCQALCAPCNSRKHVTDTDYRGLLPGFLDA